MGVVIRMWVWLECIGVISGYCRAVATGMVGTVFTGPLSAELSHVFT